MKRMRKYAMVVLTELKSAITYRQSVLGRTVFYPIILYILYSLWRTLYGGDQLTEYTLNQMVWYLCITEMIAFGCRSSVFGQMNEDVKSGAIAYQLGRPYHYVWYQFAVSIGGMLFNLFVYALLALAMGLLMVGPLQTLRWQYAPLMLLSVLMGISIQFFLHMTLGLTAFYLEENTALFLVYQKLVFMLGMLLPIEMLPSWLANAAKLLPFPYVCWGPARMIVAFSEREGAQILAAQGIWLVLSMLAALFMYSRGRRQVTVHGG